MRLPVREVLDALSRDYHPPLYFLLLYAWQRAPLGLDAVAQARALSVVFALAATVAADRLWARQLPAGGRITFLALWSLSPCLLLYSRMCRSYSLQVLVATAAAPCVLGFAERRSRAGGIILALLLATAFYTHYVLGLTLLAAANLALLRKRRGRDAMAIDAAVALAYLPWAAILAHALGGWSVHSPHYFLTGGALTDTPVQIAYGTMSLMMGEAQPDAFLVLGCLAAPLVGALAITGARRNPPLAWLAATLTAVGFVGVAHWVSYPFVPARMLFVFPPLLFLFVTGAMARPRAGAVAVAAMLALSVAGIWCYFHKTGYRNKQYAMPLKEIAGLIQRSSAAGDSAVLVDSVNSDNVALAYCLGRSRPVLDTAGPETPRTVAALLAAPRVRTLWFLRSLHDISRGKLDEGFERQIGAAMAATVHPYGRFSPLETRLMRALGMINPPAYFQELLEFRR